MSPENVLITGASRGLGAALMRRLALAGHRVVGVARHDKPLREVVASIRAQGGEASAVVADVGRWSDAARIVGEATAKAGPIDVLINNASHLGPTPLPHLLDLNPEAFAEVLAVNTVGPLALMRSVAGGMALRGRGVILNISSDAAVNAYPAWGGYGASKAALDHLSRTLAEEIGAAGVRVVALDPGEMDTRMHAQAMPDADRSRLLRPESVAERIVRVLPGLMSGRYELAQIGGVA